MNKLDERVDLYIEKSADFAKPILKHLRRLVHQSCPEITETIKWSFPCFEYKGMVCSMAAFKHHCVFGFWKNAILPDPHGLLQRCGEDDKEAMGQLGKLSSLKDLPADDILEQYIRQAVFLNEAGIKLPKKASSGPKDDIVIPTYFEEALKKNLAAKAAFDQFSYSHKKEYIEWITEAKTEETRQKRVQTSLEWLEEGKSRNWKYMKK